MRRTLRNNGLSIVRFGLFLIFLLLESITGWRTNNQDNRQHHQPTQSYTRYLHSGAFAEATFENWRASFCRWPATSC